MSVNKVNSDGSLLRVAGGTLYADMAVGSIVPFGGSTIPSGYLLCNGQAVSRTTYAELFAVIGTSFGAGDGSTTFNIPDMRESVPKGAGLTGKTVGAHLDADGLSVGEFLDDRVQEHTHTFSDSISGVMEGMCRAGTGATTGALSAEKQATWAVAEWQSGGAWTDKITLSDTISGTTSQNSGRKGATTEVKSVGVNYIIKATQTAVPTDIKSAVDDMLAEVKDVIPSNASASNQLVTESEVDLLAIPTSKFQIGSGGAVGYADLGVTNSPISQAFSWLEVEYGRVDGFIDKYFISVAGTSSNPNYIRVVRLTDYGQTPTITLDANKHIWMSMDTYVYIRVKAYGNFSISGTLSRTTPTGTTIPINRIVTENEINPTLTATFAKGAGLKSGGVTITGCKKIGDGLAVVSGYINNSSVLTVTTYQSNIGSLSISGKTALGSNTTSLFIWSQGQTPQCASCTWKTTGDWMAVPFGDGDVTLSEDAWFNAIVRYQ